MKMGTALKGTVHGRTVELDQQVDRLDGQRVLVVLEPIDEPALPAADTVEGWRTWAERGPDGPIEYDGLTPEVEAEVAAELARRQHDPTRLGATRAVLEHFEAEHGPVPEDELTRVPKDWPRD
jgi:hypothetical protein